MAAELPEQARILAEWGLPRAGLLILMSPCENRCFFCAQPAVTHPPEADWTPWARVERLLRANHDLGLDLLCIGGTEPLTHPSFARALDLARTAGFSSVQLMTSGLRLAQPDEAKRWKTAGITHVAVPIYSAEAAVHDAVCGTPCHSRLLEGLDRAQEVGLQISLHTLALNRTLEELPALAALCQDRWRSTIALAPPRPKDGVWDFAAEAPSLAAVAAAIDGIPHDRLSLMGWPVCLDADRPRGGALVMSLYFQGQDRVQPDVCTGCAARSHCPGLVTALHDRDGAGQLQPQAT